MTETSFYLDRARYEELTALGSLPSALGPANDGPLHAVCTALLSHEARLLDERAWGEWIDLLTDDVIYWVPISADGGNPATETAITLDDRRRILDRVAWIETGKVLADLPFRTRRLISNVEAWEVGDGAALVLSNFVLYEFRREVLHYAGRYLHQLQRHGDTWRIRTKQALLVNAGQPTDNITFIF